MSLIMNYLLYMIKSMVIILPICFIVRMLLIKISHKRINWYHELGICLFIGFVIGLAALTIVPSINSGRSHENSLIPFKVFIDSYKEIIINKNYTYFLINYVGNIVIFIPLGLMIPLLWNISNKKIILIGFLSSLFIELVQLSLARCSDVDDLILNTLGVIIGVRIYNLLVNKYNVLVKKFR